MIDNAAAHPDPAVRDIFERFIPQDQRIKRLGAAVRPAEILALPGDAGKGRALFFQHTGVQCKNCHRIGHEGRQLGPDLSQIGRKYDKARLLESILEPSKFIDPQYVPYLVETIDGRVLSGLLVTRSDAQIVLKQANGEEIRVPASEIERFAPQQKSLMPELLLRDMTAEQVADLLAFLVGLR